MNIQVRDATPDDSAGIAQVQVDSYRTAYVGLLPEDYLAQFSYEEQTQDWCDLMASGSSDILLVAESDGGQIAGYALGRALDNKEPAGHTGELVALHVRKPYQRRGVGHGLVAAMAERLSSSGSSSLMLWVLEGNSARQFYEKLGGVPAGKQTVQLGEDIFASEVGYNWPDIRALCNAR